MKYKNSPKAIFEDNRPYIILFGVIVAALIVILVSILAIRIPVVPVCIIVLLEMGLAACLHDVPIWLHGLVVIAEIVAGAFCAKVVFMIMCAALYVIGILALKFIRE